MSEEHTPKTSTKLYAHEAAEAMLLREYGGGKLAHGWLITGPRGIGKATLAYRFARTLLSGEPPEEVGEEHPVYRRMLAGSHSDLLVVEQAWDDKKDEKVREISVDQAREISQFLSLTPGEGQWRVVIIDAVDALGTAGANAILKILEEPPPQAVLLLISHNPGRLLPTIRSRCRTLRLNTPDRAQFTSIMRSVSPGINGEDMKALAELSGYSPGVALELYKAEALLMYRHILDHLDAMPKLNMGAIHNFADQLASGQVHANWQLFTRLVLALFERTAKYASGLGFEPVSEEETEALKRLSMLHPPQIWATKWQQTADQFLLAERLHLDYKQLVIAFFHSIATTDGLQIGTAA